MYVIRPQFFIPIITLLCNAAKNQSLDITDFEEQLFDFKESFGRNYRLPGEKFKTAIDEIDKSIDHLNKIKSALIGLPMLKMQFPHSFNFVANRFHIAAVTIEIHSTQYVI